jgi:hypothetical protein
MRKYLQLFLLAALLLAQAGCKKKLTQFYIGYDSAAVVPSSFVTALPFAVYTPETETNSKYEFENNDTRKDKIKSIYLKDLVISITSPSNTDFSFLSSIEVYITSPHHDERKIAFKSAVPADAGTSLSCDMIDIDLQSFIKDDSFQIRLRTVTDETIPEDIHLNIYTNFLVDAKLISK